MCNVLCSNLYLQDSNWYLRCEKWKAEKRKQEQLDFFAKLMSQEKSILNDGIDCFAANLHKVRFKKKEEMGAKTANKFLDSLVSCLAIIFLGLFIFVFFFLLITFWNVRNVATVSSDSATGSPAEGGARAVASYLKRQPPPETAAAEPELYSGGSLDTDPKSGQDLGDDKIRPAARRGSFKKIST